MKDSLEGQTPIFAKRESSQEEGKGEAGLKVLVQDYKREVSELKERLVVSEKNYSSLQYEYKILKKELDFTTKDFQQ